MNIKIVIQFDGTHYNGYLKQKNDITVQSVIEEALCKLTGKPVNLIGCSRTDAGVHALGYTANFHTETTIPPERISYAVNPLLPEDISVIKSELVSDDFHSRFSAVSKTYKYLFYCSPHINPLLNNRAWHIKKELDYDAMKEAALQICSTHEYDAFRAQGGYAKTTTRTVFYTKLNNEYRNIYSIEICGDGFLYNMVRIIAGTLVYVGEGKIRPAEIPAIIESKDRKRAGITAPPYGLYLYKVEY